MLIPESIYPYISLFIIALYVVLMIIGYNKGFLYGIVNMLYTILSLFISWLVSPVLAKMFPIISIEKIDSQYTLLNSLFKIDTILNNTAYFIIIFLFLKVIYIFISLLTKSLNKLPVIGGLNKILGMFIGIFNATIITLALSMLLTLPLFKNGNDVKEKTIFKYVNNFSVNTMSYIAGKIASSNIGSNNFDVTAYREELFKWLTSLNHE